MAGGNCGEQPVGEVPKRIGNGLLGADGGGHKSISRLGLPDDIDSSHAEKRGDCEEVAVV